MKPKMTAEEILHEKAVEFAITIQTKQGTVSRLNAIEWFKAGFNSSQQQTSSLADEVVKQKEFIAKLQLVNEKQKDDLLNYAINICPEKDREYEELQQKHNQLKAVAERMNSALIDCTNSLKSQWYITDCSPIKESEQALTDYSNLTQK